MTYFSRLSYQKGGFGFDKYSNKFHPPSLDKKRNFTLVHLVLNCTQSSAILQSLDYHLQKSLDLVNYFYKFGSKQSKSFVYLSRLSLRVLEFFFQFDYKIKSKLWCNITVKQELACLFDYYFSHKNGCNKISITVITITHGQTKLQ